MCRTKITGGDKISRNASENMQTTNPSSACRGYVRTTATLVLENSEVKLTLKTGHHFRSLLLLHRRLGGRRGE